MHAIESVYKPYARKAVKLSHGEYNTELCRLTDSNYRALQATPYSSC